MVNLENKVHFAYWIDLGITRYQDAMDTQLKLVELRKKGIIPDVILCTEHYPHISFGSSPRYNQFDPVFLAEVQKAKGLLDKQQIIEYLKGLGIGFHEASRGGGSTYIGPGQLVFYPIVKYEQIVNKLFGVGDYKTLLDEIMLEILNGYSIDARSIAVAQQIGDLEEDPKRADRRDVWVVKDKKNYKIGAKGIHVSEGIAFHGFNLFVNERGLDGFKFVLPCGYPKDQLDVTCMEREANHEVDLDLVKREVKSVIQTRFNYEDIIETTLSQVLQEEVTT